MGGGLLRLEARCTGELVADRTSSNEGSLSTLEELFIVEVSNVAVLLSKFIALTSVVIPVLLLPLLLPLPLPSVLISPSLPKIEWPRGRMTSTMGEAVSTTPINMERDKPLT